jgi:hypothetical protein
LPVHQTATIQKHDFAEACLIAAKEEGIAKEEIEEEVGDIVNYMSAAIEKAVNADIARSVIKDRS